MAAQKLIVIAGLTIILLVGSNQAQGQQNQSGVTIQQPTIGQFSTRGAVMVPDGGSMLLGGVSSSAMGRTSRGVPFLSSFPYLGRLFRNQGIGSESTARNARANVKIISLKEIEEDVMAQAAFTSRMIAKEEKDPNGSRATQRKADFISRNIGRNTRRR